MTIIVEDGSIVSNANSYVSEAELTSFATARGITLTNSTEELLIRAMDYIEALYFKGVKLTSTQSLQWPRAYVLIDNYYINTDVIPTELKNGLMHCAIAIDQDNDPLQDLVKKNKEREGG